MNSTNHLTNTQQQQLLMKISRFDQQKKASLSSSTLASLLQAPIQQQTRSLSNDSDDSLQPKLKRFKGSNSSSKKLLKTVNSVNLSLSIIVRVFVIVFFSFSFSSD